VTSKTAKYVFYLGFTASIFLVISCCGRSWRRIHMSR